MDVSGNKVLFTASEAHWAQEASMRFRAMPDIAQKLLDARVEFARPWLASPEFPSVSTALKDVMARVALSEFTDTLHDVTLRRATDNDGQEQHVIAIEMNKHERRGLLKLAEIDYELAREQLEIPEILEVEDKALRDDFAMFVATSDAMEPDDAVELADLLNDPELLAQHMAHQDEKAERGIRVIAPIISALQAHTDN